MSSTLFWHIYGGLTGPSEYFVIIITNYIFTMRSEFDLHTAGREQQYILRTVKLIF